ncbi:MAG: hypothetical protein HXS44_00545 [Theionarchaea archaeon]|nr:hypothetical protein [Theionarchaea archaeon]
MHQERIRERRIPSWLWRIVLSCTTDNIGEKGTHTVLRRSGLSRFIGIIPENNDSPSITVDEFSQYVKALFDIFGEEGARPILLRSGKIGFTFAYGNMPPLIRFASQMLRVLPEKKRLVTIVSEFNKAFNEVMGTNGAVSEEDDKIIVRIPHCPYCKDISTENPACYVEIGLLTQLMETAGGSNYTVREKKCISSGDSVCQFEIEKES